jgi:integrase
VELGGIKWKNRLLLVHHYTKSTPNTPTPYTMATFLKRGKTWRCQITKKVGDEIIRRSGTFPTKAQAVAWALEVESGLVGLKRVGVTGVTVARNQGMTVQEVIDRYMREVAPLHRGAKREITTLMKISREHPWLVVKPLNEVTHGDLVRFRDLRLQHVSGATVAREMVMISSMFGTACREWGASDDNPAKGVRRPKEPGAREVRIPPEAVQALSGALGMSPPVRPDTKKRQVGLAFLVALETAMRQGEILGLTWDRVHFDKKYVLLDKTKNGQSRHVPLSPEAMRLLRLAKGVDPEKVFTVTSASADTIFRKARPVEWGHIHFHDSRHEAVFRLSKKLPVMDLARMTGHQDLKMLLRYYNPSASEIADLL